jgi:hypothetical protein
LATIKADLIPSREFSESLKTPKAMNCTKNIQV